MNMNQVIDQENREVTNLAQGDIQEYGLAKSLRDEYSYQCRIEGSIPLALRGTLYRNGPGLFERNGRRKDSILDGDGMIQAFSISDGEVHYQNSFIKTEKFLAEESANQYLYPTWTTRSASGAFFKNSVLRIKSQAGVHVFPRGDKLFAFDEYAKAHKLDARSLETEGETDFGHKGATFAAHHKIDPITQEWLLFGVELGKENKLHLTILDKTNAITKKHTHVLGKNYYMHDCFVSENYYAFLLQPAIIKVFAAVLGLKPLAKSIKWQPDLGGKLLLIARNNLTNTKIIDAPALYMWHSLNAFEEGDDLICDFVGYENPDHFFGDDPQLYAIMQGRVVEKTDNGQLIRLRINLSNNTLESKIILTDDVEFPIVNPNISCRKHRYGYFNYNPGTNITHSAIASYDFQTKTFDSFDFGADSFVGEAIYAPLNSEQAGSDHNGGCLLTIVYDHSTKKSFLAILEAADVSEGPIARAHLKHHSPLSFHGSWAGV